MQAGHGRQLPAAAAANGPGHAHEEAAPHRGGEAHQRRIQQPRGDGAGRGPAQPQPPQQGLDGGHDQGHLQARDHQDVDGAALGEDAEVGLIRWRDAQGEGAPEVLGRGPEGQGLEAAAGESLQPQERGGPGGAHDFHQLGGGQVDAAGSGVAAGPPEGPFGEEDRCGLHGPHFGSEPYGRAGFGGRLLARARDRQGHAESPHGLRRGQVDLAAQPFALEGPGGGNAPLQGLEADRQGGLPPRLAGQAQGRESCQPQGQGNHHPATGPGQGQGGQPEQRAGQDPAGGHPAVPALGQQPGYGAGGGQGPGQGPERGSREALPQAGSGKHPKSLASLSKP